MNYILQVLFILVLMAIGFVARKRGVVSAVGTSEMVRVLISIIYPCLIFSSVTRLEAQELAANWIMPVMALAIAGTGLLLGLIALRCMKNVDQQRASAFLFQNTINNYLFLPLPLVMLLWKEEGVALLVFASMGFELTVWTVGVFLFNRSSNLSEGIRMMFGPPLLALIFSIGWVCVRDLAGLELPPSGFIADLMHRVLDLFSFGADTIGKSHRRGLDDRFRQPYCRLGCEGGVRQARLDCLRPSTGGNARDLHPPAQADSNGRDGIRYSLRGSRNAGGG